jgi:hypothetical protein
LKGLKIKRKNLSRPYKKNDNAHVEQKNGDKIKQGFALLATVRGSCQDKVRKLVGYFRYGSKEEVDL